MRSLDWTATAWSAQTHQHNYFQIYGDITYENCHAAIDWLLFHNINKTFPQLHLIIDSEGGDLGPAMALADIILSSRASVTTYGIGAIGSAALAAFIAGERRIVTQNTSILSHQFSWDSGEQKFHDLKAMSKEIGYVNQRMFNLYKRQTQLPDSTIRRSLLSPTDCWLTAEQAVKYNLAHEIVDTIDISTFDSIGIL